MRQSMAFDHVDCQMLNIYIYMLIAMNRVRQCVCMLVVDVKSICNSDRVTFWRVQYVYSNLLRNGAIEPISSQSVKYA